MGTDVQTQDRNILPYRSPLNYRQAFCWRLKRELIKLAPILLDKKKKERKRKQENCPFSSTISKFRLTQGCLFSFPRRRGKLLLRWAIRRVFMTRWREKSMCSTKDIHACWSRAFRFLWLLLDISSLLKYQRLVVSREIELRQADTISTNFILDQFSISLSSKVWNFCLS